MQWAHLEHQAHSQTHPIHHLRSLLASFKHLTIYNSPSSDIYNTSLLIMWRVWSFNSQQIMRTSQFATSSQTFE
jgi:hypothetical protein